MTLRTRRIVLIAGLFAMATITGCPTSRAPIAKYTYPPDFRYIDTGQVRSHMDKLARNVQSLNRIFAQGEPTSEQRAAVVEILKEMQATVAEIDPGGRETNHPLIDRNVTAFRMNLALARAAVERTPPNYYLAGSIVGACSACHQTTP